MPLKVRHCSFLKVQMLVLTQMTQIGARLNTLSMIDF